MIVAIAIGVTLSTIGLAREVQALPLWKGTAAIGDWLVNASGTKAGVFRKTESPEIVLANGLIARTFRLSPNAATLGFDNLVTKESLIRAVAPEAVLELDGVRYAVGGLAGQPDLAFLNLKWLDSMTADTNAFQFLGFKVGKTEKRFEWKRVRRSANMQWPPPGVSLTLEFDSLKSELSGVRVEVRYELYDCIPLMSKQVRVINGSSKMHLIDRFTAETLRIVEPESIVDSATEWKPTNLFVTTDYTFAGMAIGSSNKAVRWLFDPEYKTQVNYELKTPCLLDCSSPVGPDAEVAPSASFETFRVFELLHDNADRERQGLAVRKMFCTLAPWCTENPIMLHLTSTDPKTVHTAIDQAAECGFEMVIISFWSGLDMEDSSPANYAKFKEFHDYAASKGVELGGYSLLASRSVSPEVDVISPRTGEPGDAVFGSSPCLSTDWGKSYFEKLLRFFNATGFDLLEHDGSYPGDVCASTKHSGHRGLADSQWNQFKMITDYYRDCRAKGVFLNVPDNYFLQGSNKTGMGYRESNWSLPREQQHIHARQNLFDGTWEKTPSMGWMMTPLVEYQGGGPAATIEPLKDHLSDYEQALAENFGYGAQSCYRGPRLYDAPETKAVVVKWVKWFKKYRDILESDVIHVKRADGKNFDAILHVNPNLPIKAMAMIYNPTDKVLEQEITLPLYYSGLTDSCSVSTEGGKPLKMTLDREYRIKLRARVAAYGRTWYTIR